MAHLPEALEAAQRARQEANQSAKTAEDKGHRLLQLSLALITLAVTLGGFHLDLLSGRSWLWWLTLLPGGAALVLLTISAFEASQIDRVGFYGSPTGRELLNGELEDARAGLIANEDRGRRLAQWSANNKLEDLMRARVWSTRGLTALIVAAVLTLVLRATVG